jgi:hypothetical protein
MLGGELSTLTRGARDVAEALRRIKGFPIAAGVGWSFTGGAAGAGQASPQQRGETTRNFGQLMEVFGKPAATRGTPAPQTDGPQPVFFSYAEIRKITTFTIADAEFAPPAGYRKVGR